MKTNADYPDNLCTGSYAVSPAVKAWMEFSRLVDLGQRDISAALRCHQINPGQLHLLMIVRGNEGLTQQEIAGHLCHTKANVSQLLDKMERTGLVRRTADGRSYRVALTDQGSALVDVVIPELESIIARQFSPLNAIDQGDFFRMLEVLFESTTSNAELIGVS
ncbi:MAG: MarR family winged helix-turn-helix transcriptional regulator [Thermomicrobiales bacterium]